MAVESCNTINVWSVLMEPEDALCASDGEVLTALAVSSLFSRQGVRPCCPKCRLNGLYPSEEQRAFSSGGQSARLITVRSVVRVHKGPPPFNHDVGDGNARSSVLRRVSAGAATPACFRSMGM